MKSRSFRLGCAALVIFTSAVAALPAQTSPAESAPPAAKQSKKKSVSPAAKRTRTIKLFMRDGLRFEPPRFTAQPGEELVLEVENGDTTDMAHNFLLLQPGTRDTVVAEALALAEKGTARDWVPAHPAILLHTPLLLANGVATLKLRVPDTAGIYPYVCTFPGHGMMMYGAIYAGVKMPALEDDKNIPPTAAQGLIAGGGRRPFAQRMFVPEAGPAAIAVALTGSQNVVWDAGECRLRYAWQGAFIDASDNWAGNGSKLAALSATPWWRAPKGEFPLRFGAAATERPPVKFLGYTSNAAGPEFHYRVGDTEVFEQVLPRPGAPGITVRIRIPQARGTVFYRGVSDANVQWTSSAGTWDGPTLTLTPAQAADFTLTLSSALCKP